MEHSDDFYQMDQNQKLDALYRLTLQNANETHRIAKALDPLGIKWRAALVAGGSVIGGFIAHVLIFGALASCLMGH